MPTFPLPAPGSSIAGGDLPVTTGADVRAALSAELQAPTVAPVRDALTNGFAAGFLEYQDRATRAAAMVDPLKATGDYLRQIAEERGVVPTRGESEVSIRARLFSSPLIVTPDAIYTVVSSLLAPYTSKPVTLFEPDIDGWFISATGTPNWGFTGTSAPSHLDRLYPGDALTNGAFILGSSPGGAIAAIGYSRNFCIRIPRLDAADTNFAFVSDADSGVFVTDGTEVLSYGPAFVFGDSLTTDELYASIVGTVNAIKGQGITWTLFIDPTL